MSHTVGIVEVPEFSYASMARSLAVRKFGDQPLFAWVARRVTESICIDHVVVVADKTLRAEIEPLLPPDVAAYFSDRPDPLSRIAAAVRREDATAIVRVRADRPFVDPALIDRLICDAHHHPRCDYIGFMSRDGGSMLRSQLGIFAEWCRASALVDADQRADDALDRRHPTRFVSMHPEMFQLRFLPAPAEIDRDDIRLAVDHEDDWEHAHVIYDALGPDRLDWKQLAELLEQQPTLREKMADLNRSCQAIE